MKSLNFEKSIFFLSALFQVLASSLSLSELNEGRRDIDENCKEWANRGECNLNPNYMLKACGQSCAEKKTTGNCASSNSSVKNDDKKFVNEDERCKEWADEGECDVNPNYMIKGCAKSCSEFYRKIEKTSCIPINQCQLYVAESSIPNAGLGMFTSVPINPLSDIFHPEIVINVIDFNQHQELQREKKRREKDDWQNETSSGLSDKNIQCHDWAIAGECEANPKYMWKSCIRSCTDLPNLKDQKQESVWWLPEDYYWYPESTYSVHDAVQVKSLVPGLGMLANSHPGLVNARMYRPSIDGAGLKRNIDPGVGAFSPFHGLSYFAKNNIPAGMELFVDYGEEWFTGRGKYGSIPLGRDYTNVDELLNSYAKFIGKKKESFAEELFSFIRKDLITYERLQSALPSNLNEAKKAQKEGAAIYSVPNVIRSFEWLEQNGRCLDNITPRNSSLKQAGRGAFSTRPISKGDVIAPAPMLHFQRSDLHMYNKSEGIIEYQGEQLILNYSFGHPHSSLLLFPYSPVTNFINHNDDNSKVNAKIQWSTIASHHEEWLEQSVDEILSYRHSGLIMEFVATRDINEDEEIFIDYGDSWKDAWKRHVQNWTPVDNAETYVPVELLNEEDEIMTLEEQENQPYPENALMLCSIPSIDTLPRTERNEVDWYDKIDLLHTIKNSEKCSILERYQSPDGNETLYKVTVELEEKDNIVMNGVPRRAIEFVDRPYTANQHIIGAFRHEIGIPDSIFPSKWKYFDS